MNYYSELSAKYDVVSHGIAQIGEVDDEFGNELDVKYEVTISYSRREQKEVSVKAYLRENLVAKDRYYYCMKTLDFMINARYALIAVGVITAILCIILVVFLCVGAGRVAGVDGVKLMLVDKIPYDIYLGISALIIFFGIELSAESKNFVIFAVASLQPTRPPTKSLPQMTAPICTVFASVSHVSTAFLPLRPTRPPT